MLKPTVRFARGSKHTRCYQPIRSIRYVRFTRFIRLVRYTYFTRSFTDPSNVVDGK
jgi:hypothetical protein